MTIDKLKSLCMDGKKKLTDACVPDSEQSIALNLNELIEALNEVNTYGKLYSISPKAAIEQRQTIEDSLYKDICECLLKSGVLTIYSEGNPFEITYGWKLKGVKQGHERQTKEH